ncbi:serine/threonine-protein kinase [[Kitasatospora] papulosa]|uniref:serine/threonine-protein kinase n=1 Tax=[Kitasatospora] papulosa TaxID=1464011 RepID=UPI0037D138D3
MTGARVDPLGGGDPATLGRYELIGRLASGGMGRIYLARNAEGQLVAVKTLLSEGVVGEVDRRRFTREVGLAQRIDSAFTARVRDADPQAELPWMAIDYIAAPPLSELVRTAGVLPASAVQWLAAGTAEALVTLHREGIIHRDLKPQNILLPLPGPRVIDFGISHANDLTRTSLTLGTIAFTSPEQARGEPSTEASDVYSLGATLFHLALGRPPYRDGSDTLALLAQVQRGQLDLDGLPKELTALIRPCLAADPAQRPVPAEMLARFRQSLAGLPVSQEDGRRWLPQRWTDLIGAYERQGRDLARGAGTGADAPDPEGITVVRRAGAVPPSDPTRVYTREREQAERERAERERAEEARAEKERVERERARLVQERLREQEWQQELSRRKAEEERRRAGKKERENAERLAREEAGKKEREQAERQAREEAEAKARERAARARARQQASGASSASAGAASGTPPRPASGPDPARTPPPAPAPSRKASSAVGWLLVLAVVALVLWLVNRPDGDGDTETGGMGAGTSAAVVAGRGADTGACQRGDDVGTGLRVTRVRDVRASVRPGSA